MVRLAGAFIENWVASHVFATGCRPAGDDSQANQLAEECWLAAYKAGISRRIMEEAVGRLVDRMAAAIETANDTEAARQHSERH
jgi:hypothetical protein